VFENAFRNIDDILRKEAGCTTELDYTEQTSWLLFLKYLDGLEQDRADEAALDVKKYAYILDKPYRWETRAAPKDKAGQLDHNAALTGDDLRDFVNAKIFPYLHGFKQRASGPNTIEYKIGEIFGEIKNKIQSVYNLREIIDHVDELRFRSQTEKHELSHLYEAKIKNMGNAGRNGGEYYTPRPLIFPRPRPGNQPQHAQPLDDIHAEAVGPHHRQVLGQHHQRQHTPTAAPLLAPVQNPLRAVLSEIHPPLAIIPFHQRAGPAHGHHFLDHIARIPRQRPATHVHVRRQHGQGRAQRPGFGQPRRRGYAENLAYQPGARPARGIEETRPPHVAGIFLVALRIQARQIRRPPALDRILAGHDLARPLPLGQLARVVHMQIVHRHPCEFQPNAPAMQVVFRTRAILAEETAHAEKPPISTRPSASRCERHGHEQQAGAAGGKQARLTDANARPKVGL
jgi:hypothetical protein